MKKRADKNTNKKTYTQSQLHDRMMKEQIKYSHGFSALYLPR